MGSLARETLRQREMYLHLLLLISPALGMPSSALTDVGEGFINKLDALPGFIERSKAVFNDSKMFLNVAASLREAETAILEIEGELKPFENEDLQFEDHYLPAYNQAKQYLRMSRQNLRGLADRTVKEVKALKNYLKEFDDKKDMDLLKISLDNMNILMIYTLEALKEARGNYNSALKTFEDLNSFIETQNRKLKKLVTKDSAEYKAWTQELRGGIFGTIAITTVACIIADIFGALGICSGINAAISGSTAVAVETEITKYAAKLEQLKAISDKMLEAGKNFDSTIDEAISIFTHEIELINNWTNNAEVVKRNIDKYPEKYLKEYISIRTIFVNGLDDLQNSAQDFLDQPIDILA